MQKIKKQRDFNDLAAQAGLSKNSKKCRKSWRDACSACTRQAGSGWFPDGNHR
jgi:hypothetical protein